MGGRGGKGEAAVCVKAGQRALEWHTADGPSGPRGQDTQPRPLGLTGARTPAELELLSGPQFS